MAASQPTGSIPRLVSLGLAAPEVTLPQDEVARRGADLFAGTHGGFDRLEPIYRNAEIETRHACTPVDWFLRPHSFSERNDLFLENAVALLKQAAEKALAAAGLTPRDIDAVVTISSTGIATPGLDARLMEVMPFRRDLQRLPVFGFGCAGGVLGLARAASLAKAEPKSRVLLLVVELCSLTFRHADRSKSNLVATALFGDGAAAAVVSARPEYAERPAIGPSGEHTWPDSLDVMGWEVADDGLKVVFSRDIPSLVSADLRPVVERFLDRHDLTLADLDGYVCHPGGAKVIDALEATFGLPSGALASARDVLRDHGNMSAVTVLFVLEAALAAGERGRLLLTSLGPGFTAAMLVLEVP